MPAFVCKSWKVEFT